MVEHPTVVYGHFSFTSRVYEQKACAPCPYLHSYTQNKSAYEAVYAAKRFHICVESFRFCVCIKSKATFTGIHDQKKYMINMPTATTTPYHPFRDIDPFTVCGSIYFNTIIKTDELKHS